MLFSKKPKLRIGILALQGDFNEHAAMLRKLHLDPVLIKVPSGLESVHGLIIPGGESTTIRKLMHASGLDKAIKRKHAEGMPLFGTCAGAILLAKQIEGEQNSTLGLIDITIKRNAYGRQSESFEANLVGKELGILKGIFIRAPVIEQVHNGAEVLAMHNNKPVLLKDHNVLVSTFHPELTENTKVHELFLKMVKEYQKVRDMQRDIEGLPQ